MIHEKHTLKTDDGYMPMKRKKGMHKMADGHMMADKEMDKMMKEKKMEAKMK